MCKAEKKGEGQKTLWIQEEFDGVVVRHVSGEQVTVEYDTPAGPLEQIYGKDHFVDGKIPKVGSELRVQVFVWITSEPEEEDFTDEDLRNLDEALKLTTSGPIDI